MAVQTSEAVRPFLGKLKPIFGFETSSRREKPADAKKLASSGGVRTLHSVERTPIYSNKAAGWVFQNGNIPQARSLVQMYREQITNPCHPDPEIDAARRVVLVTAAFTSGHELHDRHLIRDFEEIGIDAGWKDGYPTKIRNLAVWSAFKRWQKSEKWLYQRYTEKQDTILALKRDYLEKNQGYVERVFRALSEMAEAYRYLGLYEIYHLPEWKKDPNSCLPQTQEAAAAVCRDLERLSGTRADSKRAAEIRACLDHLIYKDQEFLAAVEAVEGHFRTSSGLHTSELYLRQQSELEDAILKATTLFLYGGRVFVLMNRLRFYGLDLTLREAVRRGSNLFGISAGALIQTDYFYLAEERGTPGGHLMAADQGLGLMSDLRVFPHADDYYQYVREAHRDDLSFFALRHRGCVTVGLNQESVLLFERYRCPVDDKVYARYSSVGNQPVLVFGPRGVRYEMGPGDELLLPKTRHYDGTPRMAISPEVEELDYQANRAHSLREKLAAEMDTA